MVTYVAGPNVGIRHPAARLAAIRANPVVALTIDTENFPFRSVAIRGRAEIDEVDGLAPEYVASAHRYLGDAGGRPDAGEDEPTGNGAGPDRGAPELGRPARLHHPPAQRARRRVSPPARRESRNGTGTVPRDMGLV